MSDTPEQAVASSIMVCSLPVRLQSPRRGALTSCWRKEAPCLGEDAPPSFPPLGFQQLVLPGRYIAHLVSAKRLDALRVQRVALVTYDGHLWQAAPAEGQDVFTTGLDVAPAGGLGRPQAGLALLPLLVEN